MTTYRLGTFCFSLMGEGLVFDYLCAEFQGLPVTDDVPDIRFLIVDEIPAFGGSRVFSGGTQVRGDGFLAEFGGMKYLISRTVRGYDVLVSPGVRLKQSLGWRAHRSRFLDWNYLTPVENVAKNFMYWIFNFLASQYLVETGRGSFIHASSFCCGDRGVAIVAAGGVGKTTSMLKLVSEDGWRYLSDDLGMIGSDGRLWRTPLRMQVYAYNVAGQPLLESRLLANREWLDLASWRHFLWWKGAAGVRRRISPEDFFGSESIAVSAKLDTLVYLERVSGSDVRISRLGGDEFSRRSMAVLHNEFFRQSAAVSMAHAAGRPDIIPGVDAFMRNGESLLGSAVAEARIHLVQIPEKFRVDDLFSCLRDLLADNANA